MLVPLLPSLRDVVAVATDRPSQVAMVTTVPSSSSSPSELPWWAMNMNSSQFSWIDGGRRPRLRFRLVLLLLLLTLTLTLTLLPILRRGLRRLLLLIDFLLVVVVVVLLLLLLEFDRDGAAAPAAGAGAGADGPRRLAATVMVSSDEHEDMLESSSPSRPPRLSAVAAGNIIFLYLYIMPLVLPPGMYLRASCEVRGMRHLMGEDRNLWGHCLREDFEVILPPVPSLTFY